MIYIYISTPPPDTAASPDVPSLALIALKFVEMVPIISARGPKNTADEAHPQELRPTGGIGKEPAGRTDREVVSFHFVENGSADQLTKWTCRIRSRFGRGRCR